MAEVLLEILPFWMLCFIAAWFLNPLVEKHISITVKNVPVKEPDQIRKQIEERFGHDIVLSDPTTIWIKGAYMNWGYLFYHPRRTRFFSFDFSQRGKVKISAHWSLKGKTKSQSRMQLE